MKPNTSNDEHELSYDELFEIFKKKFKLILLVNDQTYHFDEDEVDGAEVFDYLIEQGEKIGRKQGYVKALDAVTKILNREIKDAQESREDDCLLADMKAGALGVLEELMQEIAKLKDKK